jgi:predicted transposase YdaD
MKGDTLFYRIFQEYPGLLFELTGNPPVNSVGYRFDSVAVKEPTFTIEHILPELFLENW